VPLYSTVTGEPSGALDLDADYWVRNLREPVLFSLAVERLVADGYTAFLELSPHPILLPAVQQTLGHLRKEGVVLPSLRRNDDEQAAMLGSLGALYALGRPVRWNAVQPEGRLARLPSYPWQRERFWLEVTKTERAVPDAPPAPAPEASLALEAAPPVLTRALVLAAGPAERHALVESHLRREVARVLGFSPGRLDVSQPLSTMGIDSLMAVDLKQRIEADLQISVPLIKVIEGPCVTDLATIALGALAGADAVPPELARVGAPAPTGKGDSLLLSILALGDGERDG
jgi:acyl transferase domain-containing protein